MSDTNIEKHPEFRHIGPAVLKLYDEQNEVLVDVGMVEELVLAKVVEKVTATSVYNGVQVQSSSQSMSESWVLRGRFMETLDPNTQYLAFKNCGESSVTDECSIQLVRERIQVFSGRMRTLTYNRGFYGLGVLPPITGLTAVAVSSGNLPAGDYDVTATAIYQGGGESNAYATVTATIAGDESLYIEIVPPAGDITPMGYRIYVRAPGEGFATLWAETTSTNVLFTDVVVGGDPVPEDGDISFEVWSEDGETKYIPDTDYTIDISCAALGILPDGDICDGQWIEVRYAYLKNPFSSISIGPSDKIPKIGHPVILAMKADSRSTPAARGLEIHLWKVDMDSSLEWMLSELSFENGFEFEWPVMFAENHLNFGEVYTLSDKFECYGLNDLRALTAHNQKDACEAVLEGEPEDV